MTDEDLFYEPGSIYNKTSFQKREDQKGWVLCVRSMPEDHQVVLVAHPKTNRPHLAWRLKGKWKTAKGGLPFKPCWWRPIEAVPWLPKRGEWFQSIHTGHRWQAGKHDGSYYDVVATDGSRHWLSWIKPCKAP